VWQSLSQSKGAPSHMRDMRMELTRNARQGTATGVIHETGMAHADNLYQDTCIRDPRDTRMVFTTGAHAHQGQGSIMVNTSRSEVGIGCSDIVQWSSMDSLNGASTRDLHGASTRDLLGASTRDVRMAHAAYSQQCASVPYSPNTRTQTQTNSSTMNSAVEPQSGGAATYMTCTDRRRQRLSYGNSSSNVMMMMEQQSTSSGGACPHGDSSGIRRGRVLTYDNAVGGGNNGTEQRRALHSSKNMRVLIIKRSRKEDAKQQYCPEQTQTQTQVQSVCSNTSAGTDSARHDHAIVDCIHANSKGLSKERALLNASVSASARGQRPGSGCPTQTQAQTLSRSLSRTNSQAQAQTQSPSNKEKNGAKAVRLEGSQSRSGTGEDNRNMLNRNGPDHISHMRNESERHAEHAGVYADDECHMLHSRDTDQMLDVKEQSEMRGNMGVHDTNMLRGMNHDFTLRMKEQKERNLGNVEERYFEHAEVKHVGHADKDRGGGNMMHSHVLEMKEERKICADVDADGNNILYKRSTDVVLKEGSEIRGDVDGNGHDMHDNNHVMYMKEPAVGSVEADADDTMRLFGRNGCGHVLDMKGGMEIRGDVDADGDFQSDTYRHAFDIMRVDVARTPVCMYVCMHACMYIDEYENVLCVVLVEVACPQYVCIYSCMHVCI
jgi:hypothetical protein